MILHFYATFVAVLFFDLGSSIPLPPVAPYSTCPPTYTLQNGLCYPQNLAQIPCTTCPTAVTPTPTQPCATPGTAYQNGVTQPPCSTCQTAVPHTPSPPCQTPCQNCVTQPCSSGQCPSCASPSCPITTTTSTTTTLSPPTTSTTTTSTPTTNPPRPDPIVRCPTGTILVNGYCHLIYCGSGIYRDGKCIVTICPEGTVWTGSMCEAPVQQEHVTLNITNTIYTNVNRTNDNHQMNYTNNITVHITEIPEHETITVSSTPNPETTTKSPTNCCIIVTPIACAWDGYRYNCRNRQYRQCGSICTSKYIYLTPPKAQVIPPSPTSTCIDNNCDYDTTPFYPDCSTCHNSIEERCLTFCRRSSCQTSHCQAVDMRGYCDNYRGSIGCRKMDGCNQDWCDDYSDYY